MNTVLTDSRSPWRGVFFEKFMSTVAQLVKKFPISMEQEGSHYPVFIDTALN
jgi:hypothetical protein